MKKKMLLSISSLVCLSLGSCSNSNAMEVVRSIGSWLWSSPEAQPAAAAQPVAPRQAKMMAEIAALEAHRAKVDAEHITAAYTRYKERVLQD